MREKFSLPFDSWFLSPDFVSHLKENHQDWVSLLKVNRNLEVYSIRLKNAKGQRIQFSKPHIKVEDLAPLIPPSSFQALIEKLILFAHDCLQQGEITANVFSKLFVKQNKEVAA